MGAPPEVDVWFKDLDHPLKGAMLHVRKANKRDLEAAVRAWVELKEG